MANCPALSRKSLPQTSALSQSPETAGTRRRLQAPYPIRRDSMHPAATIRPKCATGLSPSPPVPAPIAKSPAPADDSPRAPAHIAAGGSGANKAGAALAFVQSWPCLRQRACGRCKGPHDKRVRAMRIGNLRRPHADHAPPDAARAPPSVPASPVRATRERTSHAAYGAALPVPPRDDTFNTGAAGGRPFRSSCSIAQKGLLIEHRDGQTQRRRMFRRILQREAQADLIGRERPRRQRPQTSSSRRARMNASGSSSSTGYSSSISA